MLPLPATQCQKYGDLCSLCRHPILVGPMRCTGCSIVAHSNCSNEIVDRNSLFCAQTPQTRCARVVLSPFAHPALSKTHEIFGSCTQTVTCIRQVLTSPLCTPCGLLQGTTCAKPQRVRGTTAAAGLEREGRSRLWCVSCAAAGECADQGVHFPLSSVIAQVRSAKRVVRMG